MALNSTAKLEGKKGPQQYVKELEERMKVTKEWIKQARVKYNKMMRDQANKHGRKHREFAVGQLVRLKRLSHGLDRKTQNEWEGPYQVLEKVDEYEYTVQKVGAHKLKCRVHTDRLASYKDVDEELAQHQAGAEIIGGPLQRKLVVPRVRSEEYEVERIIGHRGTVRAGDRMYEIKWQGVDEITWEPLDYLVKCSDSVEAYELSLSGVVAAVDADIEKMFAEEHSSQAPMLVGTVQLGTIRMDLSEGESAEKVLEEICRRAGIRKEDIVFVWASPPCETFSRANWSNLSRGNHYREPVPGRPPVVGAKGKVAEQHDKLVARVKEILSLVDKSAMENPAHGLSEQWHMMDWEAQKNTVDLCAYGWPYKKATDLWLQGFEWTPVGRTGTGRCRQMCEQGEVNPATGKYAHYQALAVHPQRGPRGAAHASDKCGMPRELLQEILRAACGDDDITGKVVLDLCAGFQSMREVVESKGARYLAVDLEGARNKSSTPQFAGIVLMARSKLMRGAREWLMRRPEGTSVLSKADGTIAMGEVLPGETARDAAERALLKHHDVTVQWIRERVSEKAIVCERDGITLFVYNLQEVKWLDRIPELTRGARWGPPGKLEGKAAGVLRKELGLQSSWHQARKPSRSVERKYSRHQVSHSQG